MHSLFEVATKVLVAPDISSRLGPRCLVSAVSCLVRNVPATAATPFRAAHLLVDYFPDISVLGVISLLHGLR